MRKFRIPALLAMGVAALLALPGISGASHAVNTEIKVDSGPPLLNGVIASHRSSCEHHRYIWVKKVRPGRDKFVDADTTSFNGSWQLNVGRSARYRVKINAHVSSDGRFWCSGDKETVRVDRHPAAG